MASTNGNIRVWLLKPTKSGARGTANVTYKRIGSWTRIPRYWGNKGEESGTDLAEKTTVFQVKRTVRIRDIDANWKIAYKEKGQTKEQEYDITLIRLVSSQRSMLKEIELYAKRKDVS